MNWYYTFLVRRPLLVVLSVGILSVACIIVSFTTRDFPDFNDPTLGFESRGTSISRRLTAWKNLLRETRSSGKLVSDPNDIQPDDIIHLSRNNTKGGGGLRSDGKRSKGQKGKQRKKTSFERKMKQLKTLLNNNKTENESEENDNFRIIESKFYESNDTLSNNNDRQDYWEYGKNMSFIDEDDNKEKIKLKRYKWKSLEDVSPPPKQKNDSYADIVNGFFCDYPNKDHSHFVIERRIRTNSSSESLFEINSLLSMCQIEHKMQNIRFYKKYCEKEKFTEKCCRPWSLVNYVALLSNKSSCLDIEEEDVLSVQNLLINCFQSFHSLKLSNDCTKMKCIAPPECTRYDAVFHILHYLTDMNFLQINNTNINLKYSMIFLPIARSTKILDFYHEIEKRELKNDLVKVAAMDLGLKNALFDECLISDGWLVALGGVFVMSCIWIYTSSLFITIMVVFAVIFSLGNAYFIYTMIFEMSFFPFMNLLAIIVIIGVGADDAFIFVKIWQCTSAERLKSGSPLDGPSASFTEPSYAETLKSLMANTMTHSAISMFVTSATTAGAFYASYVSSITSIKCFGIFAGTAIVSNYLLMVTWLPAAISIMERIPCNPCNVISPSLSQKLYKSINHFGARIESYIISSIINTSVLWITILGTLGIVSSILVLYWPRLQLPESPEFQLFVSDHPFELYDSKFKNEFWFEKTLPSIDNFKLPLRFVWGILPIDNGDYSNPFSRGELYFDNNFNISSIESQKWLFEFCKKLKQQDFYQPTIGMLLPSCFIENFISYMRRVCIDAMDGADRSPCCEKSKFPFEPHIFDLCLPQSISSLYATPRELFIPGVAGPKFIKQNSNNNNNNNSTSSLIVKAIVIEFESKVSYTVSYTDVEKFVTTVQNWFNSEIDGAPEEMKGGWFISELDFFDLQDTLSKGTLIAIIVAMSTSLFVLFFVTFNILISLYAVVTVTFTIFTTVATLVLLGWKLNILESVSVTTAIGLAVDFSLHYGIHYKLSPNTDRVSSTTFALSRIIGPTAMATITTAVAGGFMVFSKVLPYIQIGIFLIVVMSVSWIYATFFLTSILHLIGPQYGFMQFKYPKFPKRQKSTSGQSFSERLQTQTIVSEQLLTPSSSAIGDMINSESHELDSLTSSSLTKAINNLECTSSSLAGHDIPVRRDITIGGCTLKECRNASIGSAITIVMPDEGEIKF